MKIQKMGGVGGGGGGSGWGGGQGGCERRSEVFVKIHFFLGGGGGPIRGWGGEGVARFGVGG